MPNRFSSSRTFPNKRACGFIPNPNSATVHTFSRSFTRNRPAASPNSWRMEAAIVPPVTSTTIPASMVRVTGSSTKLDSHEPSMTTVPFMVPSRGMMNAFPAGRFVNILGRLQIPLSSSFHSRQFTSKVTSVPCSDLTLRIRLRRR